MVFVHMIILVCLLSAVPKCDLQTVMNKFNCQDKVVKSYRDQLFKLEDLVRVQSSRLANLEQVIRNERAKVFNQSTSMKKRPIAFSATIMSGNVNTVGGEVIKFDKTFVNEGNGYSSETGVFSCPEDGLYQFTWDVLKRQGGGLDIDFYVNNKLTHITWSPGTEGFESRTGALMMTLRSGDRVFLKTRQSGRLLQGSIGGVGYSVFNGVRL